MQSVLLPSRGKKSSLPYEQVQWVGLTPLEWMESLATNAEGQESSSRHAPIRVSNQGIAKPATIPSWMMSLPSNSPSESGNSSKPAIKIAEAVLGTKRTREMPDTVISTTTPTFLPEKIPSFHPRQLPMYWDLSSLAPGPLVERIRYLVLTVESKPNFVKLRLPYDRTRDHFIYSVGWIRNRYPDPRMNLDMLYHETIHKLQALIDLSYKLEQEALVHNTKPPSSSKKNQELTNYMTNWLRENWTNPYPDEASLNNMAHICGCAPTVVSNWLINARTRKWRPAIVKAYEMGRPAHLLLEDSINIFSGQPVRDIGMSGRQDASPNNKRARKH
jgi:hypothetical protein